MYWNTSSGEDDERLLVDNSNIARPSQPPSFSHPPLAAVSASNESVHSDNVTWPAANPVTKFCWDGWPEMNATRSWSDRASYAFGALALGIASAGLILNVAVIFSVVRSRQLRGQVANVLLCNLAVGSLLACATMTIVEIPTRLLSRTAIAARHQGVCDAAGFVTSVLTVGTVWTVVALSVDKCRSIDSPLRHSHSVDKVKMAAYFACIWTTAVGLSSFPMLFGRGYVFEPAEGTCDLEYEVSPRRWHALVYLLLTHYIPGFIVCFCHWRIFAIARVQSRRMATMVHLVTLIQVPLLNGRMAAQHLSPQGRKAIYTTLIFVGTFVLCYLPHALVSTARLFSAALGHQMIVSIGVLLERSAFAVNIFIYGCRNRMVRDSLSKYVRRKLFEHSSALQWKRERHRRQPSLRSASRSDSRSKRPSIGSDYRRVALAPTRSQPILNRSHFTPVLPRAASLDVDLVDAPSRGRRGVVPELERVNTWIKRDRDSAEFAKDPTRRRCSEQAAAVSRNGCSVTDEVERPDVRDDSVCVLHPDQKHVDDNKVLVTSNGLLPLSPHQVLFVAMKESVV